MGHFLKLKKLMGYYVIFCLFCMLISSIFSDDKRAAIANTDSNEEVIACGYPVGLYLRYDGVLVARIGAFKDSNGMLVSPARGRLKPGDIITKMNGSKVESKAAFSKMINENGDTNIILTVRRNGEDIKIKVKPVSTGSDYKLGVWVRDDTQGIGTITYITHDGKFGALGHGVNDIDTGSVIPITGGGLFRATIMAIRKGENGNPGEFVGAIEYSNANKIGVINKNTSMGIYGNVNEIPENIYYLKVCKKYDVKKGKASIISYVSGERKEYDIEITDLDFDSDNTNKGITFKVTDDELLAITNGIVQGMSGSPIIQNGKIVGAVTHVFVNDPAKGYGIFIDNMIDK